MNLPIPPHRQQPPKSTLTYISPQERSSLQLFHIRKGLEAYKMRRGVKTATLPDFMNVMPNKIEYLDTTLGNKNVKVRHVLEF
jgi:hypothetical protein